MIDYKEALELVLEHSPGPRREKLVSLAEAGGWVLSRDIRSDMDLPPFDKSAMDGFAVRARDVAKIPATLDVIMDIPAGSLPAEAIGPGQAASIMTGAPVPDGADTVIPVELTSGFGDETVTINEGPSKNPNVSPKGEIIAAGDLALRAGAKLCIEETALLAAIGCDPVPVIDNPKVAILSTGDEVVSPGRAPGPTQIRDSNRPALRSFLRTLGIEAIDLGVVSDKPKDLRKAIEHGLEYDCLITSGGVSAGAYDFIDQLLEQMSLDIHFKRVAIKPGKPTLFATKGEKLFFGLPGNPVAAIVISQALVAPALRKMLGRPSGPRIVKARLLGDIHKKPDRKWFMHGLLCIDEQLTVEPLNNKGSADIPTAVSGDCFIMAPKGVSHIELGSIVDVMIWGRCL